MCHIKIQTHSEISRFAIWKTPDPHSRKLPVQKPLEDLTFSDDNSDSEEGHGQQEGHNTDCEPTFAASCSLSELHLLTQADLKDFDGDLNFSKKKNKLNS